MKLAYLIIAHSNPKLLRRLVESIRHEGVTIFIHIDSKSDINQFSDLAIYDNVVFLPHRIAVYWGDFSLTQAILNLLEFAHSYGHFDYYQLLSGVDYPVKGNDVIMEVLSSSNSQFMEYYKMPVSHKPLERLENFWVKGAYKNSNRFQSLTVRVLNKALRQLAYVYKRDYRKYIGNLELYAGSTWWTLSGECVDYVLGFLRQNPQYFKAFRFSLHADEMFFHTIILNSPFRHGWYKSS